MGRILMGWENGGGFGHVAAMRLVARALKARGHEPILALRDVVEPAPLLKDEPFAVLQGPYWSRPALGRAGKPFSAATFADILAVSGFADADELLSMLRAWDGLIDLLHPDLVLAEYAPMLALAARGRIPAVMFGTGFTMPPADLAAYPRLQPRVEITMPEEKVLAVVQEAQRRRGRPVPRRLPEVLACERRFPCAFPELDPYREVRREPLLPPLGDLPPPMPPPESPRFFAYLAGDLPGLARILSGLVKSGVPGGIYLRRPPPPLKDALKKTRVELYEEPVPLAEVFAKTSLVIHHGGAGTAEACLAAGRVQLLKPRHLEQAITARALRGLGVGATLPRDAAEDAVAGLVRQGAGHAKAMERAQEIARAIAARGPRPGVAPIVAACEELMAQPAAISG